MSDKETQRQTDEAWLDELGKSPRGIWLRDGYDVLVDGIDRLLKLARKGVSK